MALRRAETIGAASCQIFVKNNMRWLGKPYSTEALALYRSELVAKKCSFVFGHAGYLINLGAPPSENRERSIQALIQEIQFASQLGLPFLVLHPGAHVGGGENTGLKHIVTALDEVCRATRKSGVRIALENTAGQGTCLGHKFEHLAQIFDQALKPERLGICLDTAHLFASGYDIRTAKGWDRVIRKLSSLVGPREILAFHLNDSKTELGSRVDRHAHIGQGRLGTEAFRHIVNDTRFKHHPGCLETPKGADLKEDVANLATLRSLLQ